MKQPNRSVFEIEPLGKRRARRCSQSDPYANLSAKLFFAEHLRDRLATFIGQSVDQVDRIYRTTLGFPVPLKEDMVAAPFACSWKILTSRPLGLHGPRGRDFCAEFVDLSPSELEEAILSALVSFEYSSADREAVTDSFAAVDER